MKLLKTVVIALLLLVLVVVGVGFMLPSKFSVERSIRIEAPPAAVYAQITDLKQWKEWGVWFERDPDMQITYSGNPNQVGMASAWVSASEGSGQMEIQRLVVNQSMTYSLYFPEFEMTSTGEFRLAEMDDHTLVTWKDYGDVGNNPIDRYFALMMDSMIGADFEAGLQNLKKRVEQSQ